MKCLTLQYLETGIAVCSFWNIMNVQISILGAIVITSNGTTIDRGCIYYYVTLFTITGDFAKQLQRKDFQKYYITWSECRSGSRQGILRRLRLVCVGQAFRFGVPAQAVSLYRKTSRHLKQFRALYLVNELLLYIAIKNYDGHHKFS